MLLAEGFAWGSFLLAIFVDAVLPVVGTVLGLIAVAYARKLLKKLGLETSVTMDGIINRMALKGVAYAEEWANREIKRGNKPPGAEKLALAVVKTKEFLAGQGIKDFAEEQLIAYVESTLNVSRTELSAVSDPQ
jgi:hypothetical protein